MFTRWSRLVVIFVLGLASAAVAAASSGVANPWQGEWTLPFTKTDGGYLSIRDCQPDGTCEYAFTSYDKAGSCYQGRSVEHGGDDSRRRLLTTHGKRATAPLWDYSGANRIACTLELTLDEASQPPRITTAWHGAECEKLCHYHMAMAPAFTLQSRQTYRHFRTIRAMYVCYADPSAALRAWCTSEELLELQRLWKVRQLQIHANSGKFDGGDYEIWEHEMLDKCKTATDGFRCIADAYQERIRVLGLFVYDDFFAGQVSATQVLQAIYPGFDARTAKTGRQTDVNTRDGESTVRGTRKDELVVFFKVVAPAFLPGRLLVLDVVSDDFDGVHAQAHVTLLRVKGGRPKVVAREPVVPDGADDRLLWQKNDGSGSSLKMALAEYKVDDQTRAFGYRAETWDNGTRPGHGSEVLALYRLDAEGMKRVLRAVSPIHDGFWDSNDRRVHRPSDEHSALIVTKQQHDGKYDWVLKHTFADDRNKRETVVEARTYVWKDGEYVLDAAAPPPPAGQSAGSE